MSQSVTVMETESRRCIAIVGRRFNLRSLSVFLELLYPFLGIRFEKLRLMLRIFSYAEDSGVQEGKYV